MVLIIWNVELNELSLHSLLINLIHSTMTAEEIKQARAEGRKKAQEEKEYFQTIINDLNEKGLFTKFIAYLDKKKEEELKAKKEQLEKEIEERQKQIEEIETQLNK